MLIILTFRNIRYVSHAVFILVTHSSVLLRQDVNVEILYHYCEGALWSSWVRCNPFEMVIIKKVH